MIDASLPKPGPRGPYKKQAPRDMRFWLALASMLLSVATAIAQTSQSPRSQETQMLAPEQKAKSKNAAEPLIKVYRECDSHGCCFDNMEKRCAPNEFEKARQALQNELQRRAEEARKKFEPQ